MPRARTIALAAFVTLASLGIGAGLAYRWLLREMLIAKSGRAPTLAAVLSPRGTEGRALAWGVAFLPIFWGGYLVFMSPLMFGGGADKPSAVVVPWVVTLVLVLLMRVLYSLAWPWRGEVEPSMGEGEDESVVEAGRAAGRRGVKVTLWCGLPGLALCSLTMIGGWPEAFAVLAFLAVIPAVFAPWIGGLAALPVLERSVVAPSRALLPAAPHGAGLRLLVALGALGALGLWGWQAYEVLRPVPFAPLLRSSDFDETRCYGGSFYERMPTPPAEELVRARLQGAGISCGTDDLWAGELALDGQRLDWCMARQAAPGAQFVALGRLDEPLGRYEVDLASNTMLITRTSVLVVARTAAGLQLQKIGRDARVEATFDLAHATGEPWIGLERTRDGFVLAWQRPSHVSLVQLSEDLVPRGAPRLVPSRRGWHSLAVGRTSTCLHVSDRTRLALVLDRDGDVHRPALGERLEARAGAAFHVAWTAVVLLVAAVLALGAGRVRRRLLRSAAAGTAAVGQLTTSADGVTTLRRPDGESARVVTDRAEWYGFADREPRDGPCTIVGVTRGGAGAAYRSAPSEIDAPDTFAIVRGDLAQACAWATGHRDRLRALAVLLALVTTAPALLLLGLPF
jgi:hypothetical protein